MNYPSRRSIATLISCVLLATASVSLFIPEPAAAGGAYPVLPGGSSIKPDTKTFIQMAAESARIKIRPATEADNTLVNLAPNAYTLQFQAVWFSAIAEVQADFTMKNPTNEAVGMHAWFPLASALENVTWDFPRNFTVPGIKDLQVRVDGKTVPISVSELPNQKGTDKPLLPWASFPVTFPANAITVIHVSYTLPLQPSITGLEMALYYIFQTGSGWAGPMGPKELIVELPYPASAETVAGMPPGEFRLPPYYRPSKRSDLPAETELAGNQIRWTGKDFETGRVDDFAIWLLQPTRWQELSTARTTAQEKPQDGQAWLDLANTYHSLSWISFEQPLSIFSSSYLTQGLQAYQKAAILLPDNPAPPAGLGLLTLAPYMSETNAPPEIIQTVDNELRTALELEARDPSWSKKAGKSAKLPAILKSAINLYTSNLPGTAAADTATPTAEVTLPPTETIAPVPSITPELFPATTLKNAEQSKNEHILVIISFGAGIFIVVLITLILYKARKKLDSKG
jgi:hypothetical protein